LLAAVNDAMVALHERYHQRTPVTAKAQLMDGDLLVCVLGGVYTEVEMTLIELERTHVVHENRSAFQIAMQTRFIEAVELPGAALRLHPPRPGLTSRSSCSCWNHNPELGWDGCAFPGVAQGPDRP
jgi:hypothetical protein